MSTTDAQEHPPDASEAPWPCMRGDHRGSGRQRVPLRDPAEPGPVRRLATGGPVFSTPVIGRGERVVVGSADHHLYAWDPGDDAPAWTVATQEVIDSAACLDTDGTAYVGSGDGALIAVAADGTVRWRYDLLTERPVITPSTIWWWEANVVLGPDGHLYAGNDDFHLYSFTPDGRLRWATPTGLHLWAPCAFGADGTVLVSSFDCHLYALSPESGEVRWRRDLGNFVAAGAAVSPDGTATVGTFGGQMVSLDVATGEIHWRRDLGSPLYASAALLDDGLVVGTGDGRLVCLDPSGQVRWATHLGAPIRSSAAIYDDPVDGTLIAVGAGDGRLFAVRPDGRVRWVFDTAHDQPPVGGADLNASIAVGRYGLVTGSASGDVIYVPVDAARRGLPGFTLDPAPGPAGAPTLHRAVGARWDRATPTRITARPGDIISLRAVHDGPQGPAPGRFSVPLRTDSGWGHAARTSATGHHLHLVPSDLAEGTWPLTVEAEIAVEDGSHPVRASIEVTVQGSDPGDPPDRFRVVGMEVTDPPIVSTFDQIGLASLAIDVVVVAEDGDRCIAWGVQRFGHGTDGKAVGVPEPRVLRYAFAGRRAGGTLCLEAVEQRFEITAFPVPLTRLRLVAHAVDGRWEGGSLLAEWAPRVSAPKVADALQHPRALLERAGKPFLASRDALRTVASWFPTTPSLRDLGNLASTAVRTLPLGPRLLDRGTWGPWGLLDADRRFAGFGRFRTAELAERRVECDVGSVHLDTARQRVHAALTTPDPDAAPSLILVDPVAFAPLPLDYSRRTRVRRDEAGRATEVVLELPLDLELAADTEVVVMADCDVLARRRLQLGGGP